MRRIVDFCVTAALWAAPAGAQGWPDKPIRLVTPNVGGSADFVARIIAQGVPTVATTVPGYEAITTYSIFAPAKTPAAIITRLNQ